MQKTLILEPEQIKQKISRMAYEIAEENYDEKVIYLIGIKDQGYYIAESIAKVLKKISTIKPSLAALELDKKNPHLTNHRLGVDINELNNKVVILIDDVANTGKTLTYAIKPLLNILPKKISIAVLVDRKHKTFPISADHVGLSLSTTMQEHITVELSKKVGVYLS